jgi:hexosaminidase
VSYPANANILGIQANVWTETIVTPQRLDFMLFPRIAALAEAGWTEDRNKNFDHFNKRLREHLKLYGEDNIYYYDPFSPQNTCEPVK